jgi:transposase
MTDIGTLQTTIVELKAMGIENNSVLLDSGYFSESNVKDLHANNINFITRIPNSRTIFKNNVKMYGSTLESIENVYLCGARTIFIKKIKIDLYGKRAYLYVILDPVKKTKDIQELMHEYGQLQRKTTADKEAYNNKLIFCGILGLVSSKSIAAKEILACYYLRQSVEQVFGFLKDDLGLLPIRKHSDATIRGYLFLQFIALIIFIKIREKLPQKYTVEKALMALSGLKCKVFTNQIIPAEPTKEQKIILKNYDILVPKSLGI